MLPTFPLTLYAIISPPISYLFAVPAGEVCHGTMQYVKSSMIPLYTESPVIFYCELTLFTHGPNLVTHKILFTLKSLLVG